jgi:ubiquinone/menaquinone biosynthesis C-methylase UbiE
MTKLLRFQSLASEYALHRRIHPGVLRALLERGGVLSDDRVLEVGCGTGNYVTALHKATRCHAWGNDPSVEMLARAREQANGVRLSLGRAEALGFVRGAFDLLFSVDVIHHVTDRARYFREASRVLAFGGRICTVTDSEEIIRNREPLSNYFPESVPVELERYPRIATLREMMNAAGFTALSEQGVEFTDDLTDPQMYRDRAFSSLHLISEEAFRRGLARLESDLAQGGVRRVARYLLLWGTKRKQSSE